MAAVDPAALEVLDVAEVDLRTVFAGEASVFTPWLARPENLGRLAKALGLNLEPVETEASTGVFRVDLIARDPTDDGLVIVENQFGRSDHDHLGKALTYLAANGERGARTVVWLAERFADEHRVVLSWLNDNTPEDVTFWGVVPKVLRIGGGPAGLRFEVVVKPNTAVKAQRAASARLYDPTVVEMRSRYWPVFERCLRSDPDLSKVVMRFGGGLGYVHLFPDERFTRIAPSTHCLAFIQVPVTQQYRTGVWSRPNPDKAPPEWRDRITKLQSRFGSSLASGGFGPESEEFAPDSDLETVAKLHVARAKIVLRALAEEFEPEAVGAGT